MKLQKLLDKHKDKILFVQGGVSYAIIFFEETNDITYIYHQEDGKQISVDKSLSDLLFSTPFLSLLEWKKGGSLWAERDNINGLSMKTLFGDSSYYHKINLVLLNTDEERIKYIEEFTL